MNDSAYNALFEPCIGRRRRPDGLQVVSQGGEGCKCCGLTGNRQRIVFGDPGVNLGLPGKGCIPPHLQFRRNEPIGRVRGIVLSERTIGRVASGLKIPHQRFTNLIAPFGSVSLRLHRRLDGARSDNFEQGFFNGVVHP